MNKNKNKSVLRIATVSASTTAIYILFNIIGILINFFDNYCYYYPHHYLILPVLFIVFSCILPAAIIGGLLYFSYKSKEKTSLAFSLGSIGCLLVFSGTIGTSCTYGRNFLSVNDVVGLIWAFTQIPLCLTGLVIGVVSIFKTKDEQNEFKQNNAYSESGAINDGNNYITLEEYFRQGEKNEAPTTQSSFISESNHYENNSCRIKEISDNTVFMLKQYKKLFDDGIITEEEYKSKAKIYIDEL